MLKTDPVMMTSASSRQTETMRQFYRGHAAMYDATRWAFLHGRNEIIQRLDFPVFTETALLEVGCGTGHNLGRLARRFPDMQLVGVDVSPDMLAHAKRATESFSGRVNLIEAPYAPGTFVLPVQPGVILFSYSLTMFNPGWEAALDRAFGDLEPGGQIAVVDFHDTRSRAFRRWMTYHHVRMDGHLLPVLEQLFQTEYLSIREGGLGFWEYFLFVGRKIKA